MEGRPRASSPIDWPHASTYSNVTTTLAPTSDLASMALGGRVTARCRARRGGPARNEGLIAGHSKAQQEQTELLEAPKIGGESSWAECRQRIPMFLRP